VEFSVDRITKVLLALVVLGLAANLLRSVPPTPALAELFGGDSLSVSASLSTDPAQGAAIPMALEAQGGMALPVSVQAFGGAAIPVALQSGDGSPITIALAAGEGDRVYFYDGGSLWASKNAGADWTKVR